MAVACALLAVLALAARTRAVAVALATGGLAILLFGPRGACPVCRRRRRRPSAEAFERESAMEPEPPTPEPAAPPGPPEDDDQQLGFREFAHGLHFSEHSRGGWPVHRKALPPECGPAPASEAAAVRNRSVRVAPQLPSGGRRLRPAGNSRYAYHPS